MDLAEITQRADLLANETWGFARGDRGGDRWQFKGSADLVTALAELPDDVEALMARIRELEGALRTAQTILHAKGLANQQIDAALGESAFPRG